LYVQNDQCSEAADLGAIIDSGSISVTNQSNIDATYDGHEATQCNSNSTNGVWYKFSLASPASIAVSTCNQADFDTQIAVYSGACGSLMCEAADDDTDGCDDTTQAVHDVKSQEIYILVFVSQGDVGNFTLTVSVTYLAVSCF